MAFNIQYSYLSLDFLFPAVEDMVETNFVGTGVHTASCSSEPEVPDSGVSYGNQTKESQQSQILHFVLSENDFFCLLCSYKVVLLQQK